MLHPTLNYVVTATDVLHTCPYDKNHKVLAPRLCRHLVICRKAYIKKCGSKEPGIQICRWNYNHHCPAPLMKSHEEACPDRECMTDFVKYHSDPNWKCPGPSSSVDASINPKPDDKGEPKFQTSHTVGPPDFEEEIEDWEPKINPEEVSLSEHMPGPIALAKAEIATTGYNPSLRLMREAIIYTPQGLTKSELKAHRKREHERWKQLKLNRLVLDKEKPAQGAAGGVEEEDEDRDSEASFSDTDPEDEDGK